IAAIYVTIEVLLVIYGGALRGAGDTIWVMFAMSAMNWTCTLLLWIAAYVIKFPPQYCWLVVVCTYSSFPIVFFLRWRKEKWRKAMQI
ncbi:MAG: MATE family efflux transporter, partial [Fibrobacteraceae bacterium]